eukprot:gene14643-15895_t
MFSSECNADMELELQTHQYTARTCRSLKEIKFRFHFSQFLGAATAIQLQPYLSDHFSAYTYTNTTRSDVDIISVHEDAGWGIPWSHFFSLSANGTAPERHIADVSHALLSGNGVWNTAAGSFLTLSLVNGGCYNFDPASNPEAHDVRNAHLQYVTAMVMKLKPRFLCHAPEVNMYRSSCNASAWASVVQFANDVYAAAKKVNSSILVFPSFQAKYLRGDLSDEASGEAAPLSCQ